MTGVSMNNNKEEKDNKKVEINIENIDELSEEELMDLLKDENVVNIIKDISDLTNDVNAKKLSPLEKLKNTFVLYLKKFIIDFILVFTINSFLKVIDTNFINYLIYFSIFTTIDFIFNRYLTVKFPLLTMLSFGIVNSIITFLSFIISGIICLQFIEIIFSKFILYFVAIVIFLIIKNFVLNYLRKFRKKGKQNVSSK